MANATLAYAKHIKNTKRKEILDIEQKLRETKEMISSGKISRVAGEVIVRDLENQLNKKLSEIKKVDYAAKIKAISAMKKMGKIAVILI